MSMEPELRARGAMERALGPSLHSRLHCKKRPELEQVPERVPPHFRCRREPERELVLEPDSGCKIERELALEPDSGCRIEQERVQERVLARARSCRCCLRQRQQEQKQLGRSRRNRCLLVGFAMEPVEEPVRELLALVEEPVRRERAQLAPAPVRKSEPVPVRREQLQPMEAVVEVLRLPVEVAAVEVRTPAMVDCCRWQRVEELRLLAIVEEAVVELRHTMAAVAERSFRLVVVGVRRCRMLEGLER